MKIYRLGIHNKEIIFNESTDNSNKNNTTIYEKDKLTNKKTEIDKYKSSDWELAKKSNNDYEYIYTSSKFEKNVCIIQPVSRSYFKLHEILIDIPNLIENNMFCACIAEGPGGFIHCLNDFKSKDIQKIFGITLISEDKTIPYWNSHIINHKLTHIIKGRDGSGDIYKKEIVDDLISEVGDNYCHLVTADGGFDYTNNYNTQENISYKLFYCEIYSTLNIQKVGGNFVIKLFDLFNYRTLQLIYLLYNHYSYLEFYKPSNSRKSNSEKYLICINYHGCSDDILKKLSDYYNNPEDLYIDIPESFISDINKYNDIFVDNQIKSITDNIDSIKKKTINKLPTINQIKVAKRWCELYKLPINQKCIYL